MMRNEIARKVGYYKSPEAEDFDLWSRIGRISKIGCLPEVLQSRRIWDGQLNLKVPEETLACVHGIVSNNINNILNKTVPIQNVRLLHNLITNTKSNLSIGDIIITKTLLIELINKFKNNNNMNRLENRLVSRDVAQKLYLLKKWSYAISKFESFRLLVRVILVNYRFYLYTIYSKIINKY